MKQEQPSAKPRKRTDQNLNGEQRKGPRDILVQIPYSNASPSSMPSATKKETKPLA